jgi:hypothetical protein
MAQYQFTAWGIRPRDEKFPSVTALKARLNPLGGKNSVQALTG